MARGHPAARRALDEAELEKEWLVDVHDRVGVLGDGGCQRLQPDRPAIELLNDRAQDLVVDVVEAQLNAVMIQVSREVIVVADASKFQRRSLSVIAKLDAVHKVITDSQTSPEALAALRARNVEVIVV